MANLQVDKVKDLIGHVKANAGKLASEGVDQHELNKHIAGLEAEIKKPQPDHSALEKLLAALEDTVEKAEERLALTGVFRFLNTIFGTGVPEPPNRPKR
jgi:predicted  nucleic acid-binding Zn-ribbon protein